MTANDIINSAFRITNATASGELPSASESQDALVILNDMLDAWNAESLSIFTEQPKEFALTTAQAYTLGPGGDFNAVRPARIDRGVLKVYSNPIFPLELPLKSYTDAEWASITLKSLANTYPEGFWDDGGYPLRTLSFWPIPIGSSQLAVVLYVWVALNQYVSLNDTHTFPPAYARAIKYNLAAELVANGFGEISQTIVAAATESKATLQRMNAGDKVPLLTCDRAVQSPSTIPGVSRADFLGGRF